MDCLVLDISDRVDLLPNWNFLMCSLRAMVSAALWSICLFCQPAFATKRVALVMGNSAYQNVSRLSNPANDSAAISAALKGAGFDVVELRRDLKVNEMRRALRDFSDSVRDADIAIVYFAGHGIEIDGINYVIPVDAALERDIDAFDEAIPLDRILTVIEPARQLRLVILDACRDNPFDKVMKRAIASRAVGRGLARVEPTSPNTLVAFAAKAASTVSDGANSDNSPFTAALIRHLTRPGLDLRRAFGFARDEVLKATNNKQEPFIYGSLGGDDVALVPAVVGNPQPAPDPNSAIRRDYELAERVGTKPVWDSFIASYPTGFYTELAKAQRDKLSADAASAVATESAKAAVEQQQRLAIEGARIAEQARAAAQAKAAEEARIAAEQRKAIEGAKVAEAEQAKVAGQAKAAAEARLAAENTRVAEEARSAQFAGTAEKQNAPEEANVAETGRANAAVETKAEANASNAADQTHSGGENKQDGKPVGQLAALSPPEQAGEMATRSDKPAANEIPRLLQAELRRVGCNTGSVDGNWNPTAQRSLGLFNKHARTRLDVKVASLDALDAVRSKRARVCPLVCEHGFKADGDKCVEIVCKAGFQVGDDDVCERIRPHRPIVRREKPELNTRPERKPALVVPMEPMPEAPAGKSGDIAALYAQCRARAMARGLPGRNFARLDACARNGGHF
jgi:uncharacterized caspase-like protein